MVVTNDTCASAALQLLAVDTKTQPVDSASCVLLFWLWMFMSPRHAMPVCFGCCHERHLCCCSSATVGGGYDNRASAGCVLCAFVLAVDVYDTSSRNARLFWWLERMTLVLPQPSNSWRWIQQHSQCNVRLVCFCFQLWMFMSSRHAMPVCFGGWNE